MSNNKNNVIREKVIDRMLRQAWYSRQQLEDACNRELVARGAEPISSSQTIQSDLAAIRRRFSNAIETRKYGRIAYYRYQDRNFSVFNTSLSPEDYSTLKGAVDVLKRFSRMPEFEWAGSDVVRLDLCLESLADKRVPVGLADSDTDAGIQFLSPIFDAISTRTTISIDYHSIYRAESKTFVLSPYYLKQHNHRWFVLGKSHDLDHVGIFALDRIVRLAMAGEAYEDTDIDFDAYFRHVLGATVSQREAETVRLWVSPRQISHLEASPLHRSQRLVSKDDTGAVFEFHLIPNYELQQSILALGEHARVLEPESLRKVLKARMAKCLRNYE